MVGLSSLGGSKTNDGGVKCVDERLEGVEAHTKFSSVYASLMIILPCPRMLKEVTNC